MGSIGTMIALPRGTASIRTLTRPILEELDHDVLHIASEPEDPVENVLE